MVRASDLKAHPLNWRTHPREQASALAAIISEVGVSRSVLGYIADADRGTDDPPITLIDGHLRRAELADELVTVEILDVNDEEARKLLLTIDPLATLAGRDDGALAELLRTTEADDAILSALWEGLAVEDVKVTDEPAATEEIPEQWIVVITCKNERHQREILEQCKKSRWKAKPIVS